VLLSVRYRIGRAETDWPQRVLSLSLQGARHSPHVLFLVPEKNYETLTVLNNTFNQSNKN
jgi:hypothetical protein